MPAGERGQQSPVGGVVDGVEQVGGEALQALQVLVAGGQGSGGDEQAAEVFDGVLAGVFVQRVV